MEDLLSAGDYEAVAQYCEAEELKAPVYLCVGSDQFSALLQTANGGARAEVYSTLMAIYLHQNELEHAKLLWQRVPPAVKQASPEIAELWEIGKRLWRKDFGAVYELAENPSWSPQLAPILSSLVEKLRQRMFVLVGKAYSTIKLPDLCTLVGQSAEQAKQSAVEKGWELDTQSNVVRPKPLDSVPDSSALAEHHERLQKLTDIITFLEN